VIFCFNGFRLELLENAVKHHQNW